MSDHYDPILETLIIMFEVVQPYNYVKHGHLHLYFYLKQRK